MNKSTFAIPVAFIFGAALGSLVTWQVTKKKYEQIAQEEIDSVKEVFSRRNKKTDDAEEEEEKEEKAPQDIARPVEHKIEDEVEDDDKTVYEKIIKDCNYMGVEKPYVIGPDEFAEMYDYTTISLTYYSDGVLADENDEMVEDVENTVGYEALSHFGEYEADSVYVRNDRLSVDYEILLDLRTYSEVLKEKPYLRTEV